MLSDQDNELLTKVGPGTSMGEVMRRYWMPAMITRELPEPDCPPVRLKLLGEQLVAFRDTSGRVGVLDDYCPHRGASLFLGRNEENGLRCVYHGWKYDVEGNCVDQMNEPVQFKDKIQATAYATAEEGGVIWVYMGRKELQPPPPKFEWTQVPASHRHVSKVIEECNWLQGLEGGVDSSHVQSLHREFSNTTSKTGPAGDRGGAPTLDVDETDYGYRYAGVYPRGEQAFVRTYHYVMPFTQLRPGHRIGIDKPTDRNSLIYGHMWTPIDDNTSIVWNWFYSLTDDSLSDTERSEDREGNGAAHVDQATFRSLANVQNDWLVDRDLQRDVNFTGITGINLQDRAVQESMGPTVIRRKEHLGPADKAVITTRRLLMDAIKTVRDGGAPLGSGDSYYTLRAIQDMIPIAADWRDELLPAMYPSAAAQG
jgi:phenylpropionate dioxygenase-like ring-hydroxylating dioxygenase large terminal subunit